MFGAGTDFERRIVVKPDAPELLREAFEKKTWRGDVVVFSGVTDCYQPLEASYRLTRGCLEVCAEYKIRSASSPSRRWSSATSTCSKSSRNVARVRVMVSIPFWNEAKARAIEPFVATPKRRVHAIEKLAKRGVPVGVMVAPVIPGLNDEDMGDVLKAATRRGRAWAGWVLLRLPGPVRPVFEERLRAALPLRAERVLRRVRETRGGNMYDARFGVRGARRGGVRGEHRRALRGDDTQARVRDARDERRGADDVRAPAGVAREEGEDAAPAVLNQARARRRARAFSRS